MEAKGENVRLPGDLVYSLWVPPSGTGTTGTAGGDGGDKNEDHVWDTSQLSIGSTVPAAINVPIDTSIEALVVYLKSGFDLESGKSIPLTCLSSGATRCVTFNSYRTVLADRYFNPNSWVKLGNKVGQIKKIKAAYDFQIRHSKAVIQNVPEADIQPHPAMYPGQFVYLGGWIGCVKIVRHKVLLRYLKGHECTIYEKDYDEDDEDEAMCPRPEFHILHAGDTITPSTRDVQHAKWANKPGWIDWLFLRWLNWGYSEGICAKVISTSVDFVIVDWYIPPDLTSLKTNVNVAPPFSKISGSELCSLMTLEMKHLWYGVKGRYIIKDSDEVLTMEEWEAKLGKEFGYPVSNREAYLKNVHITADEKSRKRIDVEPGTEVTGKIVARRASAIVAWENGKASEVPLRKLIPYYDVLDRKHPFMVGEVVLKNVYGSPMRLLYGIVQKNQPGLCVVKWFGTESEELERVKEWDSTEAVENLFLCNEFKFPVGVIVVTRSENSPGVVVNSSPSGSISVKMGNTLKKFRGYELVKFDHVAYSYSFGNEMRWAKLEDKYFVNHKHLSMSMANIFNITPPASVIHAVPQTKYFDILDHAPVSHKFYNVEFESEHENKSAEVWALEVELLEANQSEGIWIKVFADRKDLMSVLMTGQPGSLYEGALFQFDILLPPQYPTKAPQICFVANYGFDRRAMSRHQLELMEIDGTLRLEKILTKRSNDGFGELWLTLVAIQYEMLGVSQVMEPNQGKLGMMRKVAFSSYTGQIEEGIRNQKILRLITTTILRWLIDPPVASEASASSMWLNEAWKYWKLQVPLFISRMKQLLQLCQEEHQDRGNAQASAGKYHFLVPALTPPDTILLCELDSALHDLAGAYCKLY